MKSATTSHLTSVRFASLISCPIHQQALSLISRAGGTNLRVCLVSLQGAGKFEITQTKYRLTEEQKHDDGEKLFDFCAECLQTFILTNMANVDEPGSAVLSELEEKTNKLGGETERIGNTGRVVGEGGDGSGNGEGLLTPGQELPLGFTVSIILFTP